MPCPPLDDFWHRFPLGLTSIDELVSSLYGSGSIICGFCTALSVLLSWCFNYTSRRCDTFTNDMVACLLLLGIALAHLPYELSKAELVEI